MSQLKAKEEIFSERNCLNKQLFLQHCIKHFGWCAQHCEKYRRPSIIESLWFNIDNYEIHCEKAQKLLKYFKIFKEVKIFTYKNVKQLTRKSKPQ